MNMASEDAGRLANRLGGRGDKRAGTLGNGGAGGRRGTGRSTGSGAGPKVARARRSLPPPDAGLGRPSLRLLPPRTRPPCSTVAFSSAPPRADGRGRRPMGAAARARRSQRERVDRGQGGARAGCSRWPSCRDPVAGASGPGWGGLWTACLSVTCRGPGAAEGGRAFYLF